MDRTSGIVPPHILEHLAEHGTEEQRRSATTTLALANVAYDARRTPLLEEAVAVVSPATVTIDNAEESTDLPGGLARGNTDPPSGDKEVDEAHDGLRATLDFYKQAFSRNFLDDAGLNLLGTVHFGQKLDNAMWNGTQMWFGDGDDSLFNRFTISIDIMAHELTHGVTQNTAALEYQGQSGALNESLSDIFGSMVKQHHAEPQQTAEEADWIIGAGILAAGINGAGLRSMKAPGTAYNDSRLGGKDPQPSSMADYVTATSDNGGVHLNSGIPNRAFYLASTSFGGFSWEKAGRIWYATLTGGRLSASATFQQFGQTTVYYAFQMFGQAAASKVIAAWQQVGVDVSTWNSDSVGVKDQPK